MTSDVGAASPPPVLVEGCFNQKEIFKGFIRPQSCNNLIEQAHAFALKTNEVQLEMSKFPNSRLKAAKVQQRCEFEGIPTFLDLIETVICQDNIFRPEYRIEFCLEHEEVNYSLKFLK